MRDFVARFAEAMDKMLDEKEAVRGPYGPVQNFIGKGKIEEMLQGMSRHADSAWVDEGEQRERELLHTANYCMMAWAKMKGYGA